MAKKVCPPIGVLAELAEIFTGPMLADMLGCSEEELNAMAKNQTRVPGPIAEVIGDLCHLHGVRHGLYQYRNSKHREALVIASVPAGWQIWSLESGAGWAKHSRWIGDPEELKLASEDILAKAQKQGW